MSSLGLITGTKWCEKWGDGSGDCYRYLKAYNSITDNAPQTGPRLNVTGGSAGTIGQYTGHSGYVDRDGIIVCPSFKQNDPQWRRRPSVCEGGLIISAIDNLIESRSIDQPPAAIGGQAL